MGTDPPPTNTPDNCTKQPRQPQLWRGRATAPSRMLPLRWELRNQARNVRRQAPAVVILLGLINTTK